MSNAFTALDKKPLAEESARRRPSLPQNVKAIVWARAAGRCQFRGCNKALVGDLLTGKDDLNTAYIARIVSDAAGGPRGDEVLSPKLSSAPSNLMLLCDPHHRLIDGKKTWQEYPDHPRGRSRAARSSAHTDALRSKRRNRPD